MCPTCGKDCSTVIDRFTDLCVKQCLCCGCSWVTEYCDYIHKDECKADTKKTISIHADL